MTWGRHDSLSAKGRDLLEYHGADGGAAGTAATYTTAEGSASSVVAIFLNYVGALDNRESALIKIDNATITDPKRGDYVVFNGETVQWVVQDVREKPDGFELRCITTKVRS